LNVDTECTTTEEGDPFDIMGEGLYATDVNCYHKMRMGWIKEEDAVTMEIPPDSDSPDFKPSDAERVTLVSSYTYKPTKLGKRQTDKRV